MVDDGFLQRLKVMDGWHRLGRFSPAIAWFVRAVSTSLYRLFELALGDRHPHNRVVRQMADLRAEDAVVAQGPNVLLFTVRGWFAHVATEAVLGTALRARGACVTAVLCGGVREQCDFKPATDARPTSPLCRRCQGFAERAYEAAGIPVVNASDHWPPSPVTEGDLASLDVPALEAFVHRGHPVGQWVLPSVQRSLLRGDIGDSKESLRVLRGFVAAACGWVEACERLLADLTPELVILTNGSFHAERVMLGVAEAQGIRVVSYERGMLPNSVVVGEGPPVVPFDPFRHGGLEKAPSLTEANEAQLEAYLQQRETGKVGVGQPLWESMERGREVLARLGVDPERQVAVMFTNILWDSAVFRRDEHFTGMADWVLECIRVFAAMPDRQLVIRVHPAEVRLVMAATRDRITDRIAAAFPVLPDNVILVGSEDPASSYELLGAADIVLTYTSTVGMEAACRGIPVVAAGLAHYRDQGFTPELEGRAGLQVAIGAAFGQGRLAGDALAAARAYAHHFFFRYHRPFPWLDDRSRATRSLLVGAEDLAPGQDPDLDHLCEWLLGQTDLRLDHAGFEGTS